MASSRLRERQEARPKRTAASPQPNVVVRLELADGGRRAHPRWAQAGWRIAIDLRMDAQDVRGSLQPPESRTSPNREVSIPGHRGVARSRGLKPPRYSPRAALSRGGSRPRATHR